MTYFRFLVFSSLVTLTGIGSALAWGGDGHRIVCAIAWDELKPATRQKVEVILNVNNKEQFADLCNWADEYRESHPETAGWHFINVKPGETTVNMERDCPEPQSCVVEQIAVDTRAIASKDPTIDKAASLKFLMHFVGDVHQPLHVGFREDHGGNEIKGRFFGRQTNMHQVWDTGIIAHDGRPWQKIATALERSITPKERKEWANSTPLDWANQSLAIAEVPETQYVNHATPFSLGQAYERRELPVVRQRLKQASVRLAAKINEGLK